MFNIILCSELFTPIDPPRPRPNRLVIIFTHGVRTSVRKSKTRCNVNVDARKTNYALRRTPCMKIMTTIWMGLGGSS